MRKIAFLFMMGFVIFSASPLLADRAASQSALSLAEEEPFLASFPFFYSYESGQWVSSEPGKIFTTGAHDPDFLLPELKEKPKPIRYPRWALAQGWEGELVVAIEIRADGTVGRWKIMRSTGHELLDQATVQSIRQWLFRPGELRGKPMVSCIQIPVRFVIDKN